MINCVNFFLEFIINISIVIGIFFVLFSYFKLRMINLKIEDMQRDFERKRDELKNIMSKNGGTEPAFINSISELQNNLEKIIAPLKREKERIIEKIPFLK